MQLSSQFNRLYHSIIGDFHTKARAQHMTVLRFETFKDELKKINPDYPRQDDKPISTTKCDNKQICQHIEFITAFAGEFGFTLAYSDREWDRLLQQIR